jgi:hypothetical protein
MRKQRKRVHLYKETIRSLTAQEIDHNLNQQIKRALGYASTRADPSGCYGDPGCASLPPNCNLSAFCGASGSYVDCRGQCV